VKAKEQGAVEEGVMDWIRIARGDKWTGNDMARL